MNFIFRNPGLHKPKNEVMDIHEFAGESKRFSTGKRADRKIESLAPHSRLTGWQFTIYNSAASPKLTADWRSSLSKMASLISLGVSSTGIGEIPDINIVISTVRINRDCAVSGFLLERGRSSFAEATEDGPRPPSFVQHHALFDDTQYAAPSQRRPREARST